VEAFELLVGLDFLRCKDLATGQILQERFDPDRASWLVRAHGEAVVRESIQELARRARAGKLISARYAYAFIEKRHVVERAKARNEAAAERQKRSALARARTEEERDRINDRHRAEREELERQEADKELRASLAAQLPRDVIDHELGALCDTLGVGFGRRVMFARTHHVGDALTAELRQLLASRLSIEDLRRLANTRGVAAAV
jgi:hypothetical protein